MQLTSATLKRQIRASLKAQGFELTGGKLAHNLDKDGLRLLNRTAVQHRTEVASKALRRFETKLLDRFACGASLDPTAIQPVLVEVARGSEDELLFRYATLHWSIPVSSGYGRRLRFLVLDASNGKLIGIIGLGDPIFALKARDQWVGWSGVDRTLRLRNVMDAFVLGAVPPYRELLCGKLVAMLASSDEVRRCFARKYANRHSLISDAIADPRLALITTSSALGRSSVYNRVRFEGRTLFQSVGYTKGYGEFHFANGLYKAMHDYTKENCVPTAKHKAWGDGFRNRREVIKKCLMGLDLPTEWLNHGIQREVFAVPLAKNTREFLCGTQARLRWEHTSAADLSEAFLKRWLLPRASRDASYKQFSPGDLRLWKE